MDPKMGFHKICRICMGVDSDMFSLFDKINDCNLICEKVMCCTTIKVEYNDNLPTQICKTCTEKLDTAFKFKRLCEETDAFLRKYLDEAAKDYQSTNINSSGDFAYVNQESDESCNSNAKIHDRTNNSKIKSENTNTDYAKIKTKSTRSPTHCVVNKKQTNKANEDGDFDVLSIVLEDGFNGYSCEICDKAFDTKQALRNHIKRHEDLRPFQCEACKKSFKDRTTLKVHSRIHTGEKPFSCDFCPMTFVQNSSRKSHMRQHSQETPYQCDICGKLFKISSSYSQHLEAHKNERNFVCGMCGARFNFKNALRKHTVVHTGKRTYICKICEKGFRRPENLKNHMRVHSDEMPFKCELCSKAFRYNGVLKAHLKSRHATADDPPTALALEFAQ